MSLKKFAMRRPGLAVAIAAATLMAFTSAHASKVVRDAQTGQLRAPNATELAAEQAAASGKGAVSRAAAPRGLLTGKVNPQPVTHADGTVSQELDESTLMYSTVTRNADGTLTYDCVAGHDEAEAVVKGKKGTAHTHTHKHAVKEQRYEK
jgi:hypothetical protein